MWPRPGVAPTRLDRGSIGLTAERAGFPAPPALRSAARKRTLNKRIFPNPSRVQHDISEVAGRSDGVKRLHVFVRVLVSVLHYIEAVIRNVRGGQRRSSPWLGPSFNGSA